jgi:hypothetical protein
MHTALGFSLTVFTLAVGLSGQSAGSDDSQVRPPVTKDDIRIVELARKILDSPAKWNRADNRQCPATAKTFSLYCALEKATDEVSGNFQHRGAAMQEARFVIDEVAPNAGKYEHRLMGYNNDPTTTFADVQKVFRLLQERIEKRLKDPSNVPAPPTATPPAEPVVTKVDLQILKRAREILSAPPKWNRASTQTCPATAETFGVFCALERAATEVKGAFDFDGVAIDEVRAVISEVAENKKYKARLVDYNNDPATSFEDIQKLFQIAEERLAKRLAEQAAESPKDEVQTLAHL